MSSLTLVPSYGRDYSSVEFVKKAWNANQDFRIVGNRSAYVNKQQVDQLKQDGFVEVTIRYKKLTKGLVIPL